MIEKHYLGTLKIKGLETDSLLNHKKVNKQGVLKLYETLKIDTSLTSLDVRDNDIGTQGAQALSEALKINTSLIFLDLRGNDIGTQGAQALSEALKINTSLIFLDLKRNDIGTQGAQALSEALKIKTSSLIFLDLKRNNIGTQGAQALSEALEINTSLTSLELGNNDIGSLGAQVLSEALKINTSLTSLDVRGNDIGTQGAQALSEALKINTSLTSLDLHDNNIGEQGLLALKRALEMNISLTHLSLPKIDFSYDERSLRKKVESHREKIESYINRNKQYADLIKNHQALLNAPYNPLKYKELRKLTQTFSTTYPIFKSKCKQLLQTLEKHAPSQENKNTEHQDIFLSNSPITKTKTNHLSESNSEKKKTGLFDSFKSEVGTVFGKISGFIKTVKNRDVLKWSEKLAIHASSFINWQGSTGLSKHEDIETCQKLLEEIKQFFSELKTIDYLNSKEKLACLNVGKEGDFGVFVACSQDRELITQYLDLLEHLQKDLEFIHEMWTTLKNKNSTLGALIATHGSPQNIQHYFKLLNKFKENGVPTQEILEFLRIEGKYFLKRCNELHIAEPYLTFLEEMLKEGNLIEEIWDLLNQQYDGKTLGGMIGSYSSLESIQRYFLLLKGLKEKEISPQKISKLLRRGSSAEGGYIVVRCKDFLLATEYLTFIKELLTEGASTQEIWMLLKTEYNGETLGSSILTCLNLGHHPLSREQPQVSLDKLEYKKQAINNSRQYIALLEKLEAAGISKEEICELLEKNFCQSIQKYNKGTAIVFYDLLFNKYSFVKESHDVNYLDVQHELCQFILKLKPTDPITLLEEIFIRSNPLYKFVLALHENKEWQLSKEEFEQFKQLWNNDPNLTSLEIKSHQVGVQDLLVLSIPLKNNIYLTSLSFLGFELPDLELKNDNKYAQAIKVINQYLERNKNYKNLLTKSQVLLNASYNELAYFDLSLEIKIFSSKNTFFKPQCDELLQALDLTPYLKMKKKVGEDIIELIENNDLSLKELCFEKKNIDDNDIRALSKILKKNTCVTSVNLSNNNMSDESAFSLSEVLKINSSLSKLDLSYNQLSSEGICSLSEVLKVNSSLKSLNLSHIHLDHKSQKALEEMLRINTSLIELGSHACTSIEKYLNRNKRYAVLIQKYETLLNAPYNKGFHKLSEKIQIFAVDYPELKLNCEKLLQELDAHFAKKIKEPCLNQITDLPKGKVQVNKSSFSHPNQKIEIEMVPFVQFPPKEKIKITDHQSTTFKLENYQEIIEKTKNLLDYGSKTNKEAFIIFLTILNTADFLKVKQKLACLKITNLSGFTLGMLIASSQDFEVTQQYLTLLKNLKVEGISARKIIHLLKTQDNKGRTLGAHLARCQNSILAQDYLSFLKTLQSEMNSIQEIWELISTPDKNNITLGMVIAASQDVVVIRQYLKFLNELNFPKVEIQRLMGFTSKGKNKSTFCSLIKLHHSENYPAIIYELLKYEFLSKEIIDELAEMPGVQEAVYQHAVNEMQGENEAGVLRNILNDPECALSRFFLKSKNIAKSIDLLKKELEKENDRIDVQSQENLSTLLDSESKNNNQLETNDLGFENADIPIEPKEVVVQTSPNLVNEETEEDIYMKEMLESQARRIEELEKTQNRIYEIIEKQDNQIKVLNNTIEIQKDLNKSLQSNVVKLSEQVQKKDESNSVNDMSRNSNIVENNFQPFSEFTFDELKRLIVAVPKLLDGLVARGAPSLELLKKLLSQPGDFNLKGLCLIPFADALNNLEHLKECGAIISWDQLQNAIEVVKVSSKIDRPYVKRLISGLEQLEKAWHQGKLSNIEVQDQLNEQAYQALKERFPGIIDGLNDIPFPEVQQKFKDLRGIEIEQWSLGSDDLSQERRVRWDGLVKDRILTQWFTSEDKQNPLSISLGDCLRFLLVEQFKIDQLPERFKTLLNQEALCEMICEKVRKQVVSHAFQRLILAESKLLKGKYPHDKEGLEKAVAAQIYQKWFSGELQDPGILKELDKMGCDLLEVLKFDQMGNLHSNLKKAAVDLLLKKLREQALAPLSESALMEVIQAVLHGDKYTEEQKDNILKEIHEAFKEGKIQDEGLIALCSGCLRAPLTLLKEKLEPQPLLQPVPLPQQGNNSVTFFQSGENQTSTPKEPIKEMHVSFQ